MAEMQTGGQGDRGFQPTFGFTARGSGNFLLQEIVENGSENYNRGQLADDVPGWGDGSAQDAGGQFEPRGPSSARVRAQSRGNDVWWPLRRARPRAHWRRFIPARPLGFGGRHPGARIASDEMSMEVTTEYLGKAKFAVTARGHRVICDQPIDNRGEDKGMTPPEFMLAALGSCAAYYAVEYLNARGLETKDLTVRVAAEKHRQPARLGSFRIEVHVPGLEEQHRTGVMRAVRACLIHNTLLAPPSIEIEIDAGVPAAA